eukprot:IDg17930t1
MQAHSTGDQLQQLCCAANWMRASIPKFNELIDPLTELLELVYAQDGKRTKRAVSKVQLADVGWTTTHDETFQRTKTAL